MQVLSVVAQQVLEIQLAVKAKLKTFVFEGSELTLRPSCNVFGELQPSARGGVDCSVVKWAFLRGSTVQADCGMVSHDLFMQRRDVTEIVLLLVLTSCLFLALQSP